METLTTRVSRCTWHIHLRNDVSWVYTFACTTNHSVEAQPEELLCGAEGAFGTVEKRKMVDKDGRETFVAVKKLKRQDMNLHVRC